MPVPIGLVLFLAISSSQMLLAHEFRRWESTGIVNCTEYEFECVGKDDGAPLVRPIRERCDGWPDRCREGADEKDCTECRTPFSKKREDGFLDCMRAGDWRAELRKGGEDERKWITDDWKPDLGCAVAGEMRCPDEPYCVPKESVCNGRPDCLVAVDEAHCEECRGGAKMCEPLGKCIMDLKVCDGKTDCPDGSDERDCTCAHCSGRSRALCGNGRCIDSNRVCDGVLDCEDASDEQDCPTACGAVVSPSTKLPALSKHCWYNIRYLESELCAGAEHWCSRNGCPPEKCDERVAFPCKDSIKMCLSKAQVCDGHVDCEYSRLDEQGCSDACKREPNFKCKNGDVMKCIGLESVCDAVSDCIDGSDESNCDKCPADAIHCDRRCMSAFARCDGVKDCSDGSDETNCSCEECSVAHIDTYSCETSGICMKRSAACGPHSLCPHPTYRDELFCVRQTRVEQYAKSKSSYGVEKPDYSRMYSDHFEL